MKIYKIIGIFILGSILAACEQNSNPVQKEDQSAGSYQEKLVSLSKDQMETINLKLENFAQKSLNSTIKATGNLDLPPENKASVSTFMAGYVKKVPWLMGDFVKKGQILTVLENPEYIDLQQQLLEARSDLDYLTNELERQEALAEEQINAEKILVKTKSDYQKIRAKYQSLTAKLKMIGINPENAEKGNFTSQILLRSPINGFIAQVNVKIGEYVNPSQVLFELLDKSHMHLELQVYEKDVNKVEKGQKIEFLIPGEGDSKTYEGEVFQIAQHFDPGTRTINVHGHIKDEAAASKLKVGTYIEAAIITEQQEFRALPESAVVKDGFHNYIFVKDREDDQGMKFSRLAVNLGTADKGWVAVQPQGNFNSDAMVVTEGAFYLASALGEE